MATLRDIGKGAIWVLVFKLVSRFLGLLSIVMLARLLAPADFGLVALAMATIAALELASDFSLQVALIQNQNAVREHYDTVWTINLALQSVVTLVLILSAVPVAAIFDEPDLRWALYALACVPLLDALQNIRIVDYRKYMQFDKDFTFLLSKRLIGFSVTVPLAFYLRNHWALVAGMIAGRAGGVILSYWLIPYRPRFGILRWQGLFRFSLWLFLNNILVFIRYRASSFIIGNLSDVESIGIFEVSNEIASMPGTELIAPINRAVLPGLSSMNDDRTLVARNYLRIIALIVMVGVPAGIGISAVAEPLVHVMLGAKWLEAIPIISILGIASAIACAESNTATTCIALGRPDLVTRPYFFYVLLFLVLAIWFTAVGGAVGTAWAWLVASAVYLPIFYIIMLKAFDISVLRFVSHVWRPMAAGTLMFFVVRAYVEAVPAMHGAVDKLPVLLIAIVLGATVYGVIVTLLWLAAGRPAGAEQEIMQMISEFLRRRFRSEKGPSVN